nr:MAG TPA: hypothetical protein [Caudoviricetes sp.]
MLWWDDNRYILIGILYVNTYLCIELDMNSTIFHR